MSKRTVTLAAIVGLAGAFAFSATVMAAPKAKSGKGGGGPSSYEAAGAKPGMAPPVPGFALASYKPGMCYKVYNKEVQLGNWVPCSKFFKGGE